MYSAQVLDHFQNPRNTGEVQNPDTLAQLENPACGDVLSFALRLEGGRIAEIRFLAQGCVATVACASALTELALQKTVHEARLLNRELLLGAVGGLPAESSHASHLAIDTLHAVLRQLPSAVAD